MTVLSSKRPPSVGILDFHPIQYHSPLYQCLATRGNVSVDVLYLSDHGLREYWDPGFRTSFAWDIDLLAGYPCTFLLSEEKPQTRFRRIRAIIDWIKRHDVVVIHGYSNPWMLLAMLICKCTKVPYLLRGDSKVIGNAVGIRRRARDIWARIVVSHSSGGLAVGRLNTEFYRRFGARQIFFAPHSVDDTRFRSAPPIERSVLLAKWGMKETRPVVLFCGKLTEGKRPFDVLPAVRMLPFEVTVLFVGDGPLASQIEEDLNPANGVITGFVNQLEIPSYYHAADVLVLPSRFEQWGLVINEAMAAGVIPVVSDQVGAARDLASGVGEVYKCGDISDLAASLARALPRARKGDVREQVQRHVSQYSLSRTALGFEQGAIEAALSCQHVT